MIFTNRTQYLAEVARWKADYAVLAQQIRRLKREFRDCQRASALAGEQGAPVWGRALLNEHQARRARQEARQRARDMLHERADGKREAQRQWQAELTSARVAMA